MEPAFLGAADESDVIFGVDLQPVQDRWEVIGNAAALSLDDRSAGPVDEFEIVLDLVRDPTFVILRCLVTRCLAREQKGSGLVSCTE